MFQMFLHYKIQFVVFGKSKFLHYILKKSLLKHFKNVFFPRYTSLQNGTKYQNIKITVATYLNTRQIYRTCAN